MIYNDTATKNGNYEGDNDDNGGSNDDNGNNKMKKKRLNI